MTLAAEKTNDASAVRPADPCIIILFGANGDLTERKLIPALHNLANNHLLPESFALIGISRSQLSHDDFRQQATKSIQAFSNEADTQQQRLVQHLYYLSGDVQDDNTYKQLNELLSQVDQECHTSGNYLFYLATAPQLFGEIISHLGAAGLAKEQEDHWRRIIIEKPFGHNLESACDLNNTLSQTFQENQIYRIDHYLGKETVQNILAFRFGNAIFEPIWDRRYIDHVQITVAETVGVESRGNYYEGAGALRDMVQNHMFQLLTLVAMEPPASFNADDVRNEKVKVLSSIVPLSSHVNSQPGSQDSSQWAVRGQYDAGTIAGKEVPAYRDEPDVASDSATETFAALKLAIDNWRWADVPFYLRTGKRLPKRATEIAIQFKRIPFSLFRQTPVEQLTPNFLILCIQPNEGIHLQFGAKVPGPTLHMDTVDMDFEYADYFGKKPSTGYETLLYDCMIGDPTLFRRADTVEAAWEVVMPVLDAWHSSPPQQFPNYKAGTWGPEAANELIERDGRQWREL
jgi:glucose-6-phosphate 1-dehydrogenase